ncbi:hypothetical protein J3R30DRAFT_1081246 [Lentinula aciculospora]|uniref:F-box domain-containing protein n=1 Tax=Lentinula aciculospora TaxID=153920 RepID=A0A9W9A1N6_9AGAR|nr:hypothetical protein J3R30DRAFT_1081246 [Lentinula aciculospora]
MHSSNFSSLLSRMPRLQRLQIHKSTILSDKYNPDQVIAILSSTPKIQSITLSIGLSTPHIFHDLHIIHLPNLTSMKLTFLRLFTQESMTMHRPDVVSAFETEITSIFDCIQCNALHSLTFLCHHILLSRLPFIGLPLHVLETLELTMPMTPEMMAQCISKTPNLVSFQLTDLDDVSTGTQLHADPLQDSYLFNLTPSPTILPTLLWWPNLQSIRILSRLMSPYAYRDASAFSPATLTQFLKSRSENNPRLKCCDILFRQRPSFSEAELETLQGLKKHAGLKLRLNGARCPSVWEFGPDSPETGLVEPPNSSKLSDMECIFGTDVIV